MIRTLEQKVYGGQERYEYSRDDAEDHLIKLIEDNKAFYVKMAVSAAGRWASKYNPRYVWAFWQRFINKELTGYEAKFRGMTQAGIRDYIECTRTPIVIGTKLTHAGHIVVCVGFDEHGFYLNDPYGDPMSRYKNHNGAGVYVPYHKFRKRMHTLTIKHGMA